MENSNIIENKAKKLATIVYILQALGFIVGFTFIAAVITNYIKRKEVKGILKQTNR